MKVNPDELPDLAFDDSAFAYLAKLLMVKV